MAERKNKDSGASPSDSSSRSFYDCDHDQPSATKTGKTQNCVALLPSNGSHVQRTSNIEKHTSYLELELQVSGKPLKVQSFLGEVQSICHAQGLIYEPNGHFTTFDDPQKAPSTRWQHDLLAQTPQAQPRASAADTVVKEDKEMMVEEEEVVVVVVMMMVVMVVMVVMV